MNLAFGLYIASFALTLLALSLIPFVLRLREGATILKSGEPMLVVLTILLLVPAGPSLGGQLEYRSMVWITAPVFFTTLQWFLLARVASAIVRRWRLPGWLGITLLVIGLIAFSVLNVRAYVSVQTWLMPPLTVLLATWFALQTARKRPRPREAGA